MGSYCYATTLTLNVRNWLHRSWHAFVFVYSVVYTSLKGFGQYEICFLHIVISGIRMLSSHSPARSLNEYEVCRHLASAEAGSTHDITSPRLSCFCADRTSAAVSCQYSASLIRVGMTRSSRTCWPHEGRRLADLYRVVQSRKF